MGGKIKFRNLFFLTLSAQGCSLVISMLNNTLIARRLGPGAQGVFTLVVNLAGFLSLTIGLGLQSSSVYLSGKYTDKIKALVSNLALVSCLSFCFLVPAYMLGSGYLAGFFGNRVLMAILVLAVPFMFLQQSYQSVLLGIQHIIGYNLVSIVRVLSLLASNTFLLFILSAGINAVMAGWLAGVILTALFSLWILSRRIGGFRYIVDWPFLKDSVKVGVRSLSANFVAFLLFRSDIYIIKVFYGYSQLGYYSVAVLLAELLLFVPQIAGQLIMPKASQSEKDSHILTARVNRMSIAYSLIFSLFLFIFGKRLVILLFGSGFSASYPALLFLIPGVLSINFSAAIGYYISGNLGYPSRQIYILAASFLMNLLLNIILIPRLGITGAALSSSVSYISYVVSYCIFFKKITGLRYRDFLLPRVQDFRISR